jgi:choline kinase
MQAIILAAGRGSRMDELTDDRPKCLVDLRGKPLLEWQVDALRRGGAEEIAIVSGYRREALAAWGLQEFHNCRWNETNMVYSLMQATTLLEKKTCIISYSDIFYDYSIINSLKDSDADIVISYDINWISLWTQRFGNPLLDAETFQLHPNGTVKEIGGKPTSIEDVEGQYMGLLRITPTGWSRIKKIYSTLSPQRRQSIHMTGLLQVLIDDGRIPVHAIPYSGEWGEVDNKNDIKFYNESFNKS